MNGLQTEEQILDGNTSLSLDIARRIAGRLNQGSIVVVSKQPKALLSSVRKQWFVLLRQLQNDRARTLDATKIDEIADKISNMQQTDFAVGSPREVLGKNVLFSTTEQLLDFAPPCRTMLIATPTDREIMHKVTSFMPAGGLLVIYRGENSS